MSVDQTEAAEHLERCIHAACALEVRARKPGNVHPDAAFIDLTADDLERAGEAVAPVIARAGRRGTGATGTGEIGIGATILQAVQATQRVSQGNPNLGIILLLTPLAAVPLQQSLAEGIGAVLDRLTVSDAELTYEAIRIAKPGGMGKVAAADLAEPPRLTLREAMALAAERDLIAAQYGNQFELILQTALPWLQTTDWQTGAWERAIQQLQLRLLSEFPDSLIQRKCGRDIAEEASLRAKRILDAGWPDGEQSNRLWQEYDQWLRADGHRRNPGTTADLIAATLFAGFRERLLPLPEFVRTGVRPLH